jgi:hypothetical protein
MPSAAVASYALPRAATAKHVTKIGSVGLTFQLGAFLAEFAGTAKPQIRRFSPFWANKMQCRDHGGVDLDREDRIGTLGLLRASLCKIAIEGSTCLQCLGPTCPTALGPERIWLHCA